MTIFLKNMQAQHNIEHCFIALYFIALYIQMVIKMFGQRCVESFKIQSKNTTNTSLYCWLPFKFIIIIIMK